MCFDQLDEVEEVIVLLSWPFAKFSNFKKTNNYVIFSKYTVNWRFLFKMWFCLENRLSLWS